MKDRWLFVAALLLFYLLVWLLLFSDEEEPAPTVPAPHSESEYGERGLA